MPAPAGERSGRTARPVVWGLATAVLLFALLPRVSSRPGAVRPAPPLAPEHAVRVRRGDVTLVYDKRRSWLVAKSAELYPNTVCAVVPADHVERSGVVHETEAAWTFPWWRGADE